MSTVPKPQQVHVPPSRQASTAYKVPVKPPKKEQVLLFERDNYLLMAVGVALIFIGFRLMSGGKSLNPHEFHYEEIYSFRRITLAPIVVLLGFVVEVFAIMKKPKETAQEVI